MNREEMTDLVERIQCLWNSGYHMIAIVPCMGHVIIGLKVYLHPAMPGFVRKGFRIAKHCLQLSDLYENRWQSFQVGIYWRRERVLGVDPVQIESGHSV